MTSAELQVAVLQELGVLASGESANAADGAIVTAAYGKLYEMLLTEGLVSWTDSEDIPLFAAEPLTWMVAYLCCGSFGVTAQKKLELRAKGGLSVQPVSDAERILRRQLARGYVSAVQQTEYF